MKKTPWILAIGALAIMAVTAGFLSYIKRGVFLEKPGVRISAVPIYDSKTNLVSKQSIVLPTLSGVPSVQGRIDFTEVAALPRDTTYGLRYYSLPGSGFQVQLSVVLMGTDHTSIHMPEYCLPSQGWSITKQERVLLHMTRPYAYDIPAVKLTSSQPVGNSGQIVDCLYIYWFVSADKITAEEGSRLWSIWKTMLRNGKLERWAYISYFAACLPGTEEATFNRLEKFIQASVPEFQTVTGAPSGALQSDAAAR